MAIDDSNWASLESVASRVRSSRLPVTGSVHRSRHGFQSGSLLAVNHLSGLDSVIDILKSTQLPGPMVLIGDREYIGQGSQFIVHKRSMAYSLLDRVETDAVAVKQPKFNINPSVALDLATKQAQRHLDNICLEIKALTTPSLQLHPNIVRLLSWSLDSYSVHRPLNLIMELASSDLFQLLSKKGEEISSSQRYALCSHIASGLDAIHGCNLIHGDLKPENVLIFDQAGVLVAKLADFGLSVTNSGYHLLGGTPGWQAPEVEEGRLLTPQELLKADNYSFGLTAWSTVFGSGKRPSGSSLQEREASIRNDLENPDSKVLPPVLRIMRQALQGLINRDPSKRPTSLGGLFNILDSSSDSSASEMTNIGISSLHPVTLIGKPNEDLVAMLSWELPCLPDCFGPSLASRFMTDPDGITPANLFQLFLRVITKPEGYKEIPAVDVLLKCASKGFHPAQAIVPTILEYYQMEPPASAEPHIRNWLEAAISTGSTIGRQHLQRLSPTALDASIKLFKDNGGYGRHYYTISYFSSLHALATYGTLAQLKDFLCCATNLDLEARTADGETPLYLACARGTWDIASELLAHGADASVKCTRFQISCLHWIFSFDPDDQLIAAQSLIKHGCDINSICSQQVPFYHYPFVLPAGSPLHWAVVTASHTAVQALVENGAELTVRDSCDPYKYDDRVRLLDHFVGQNQTLYSLSDEPQGLSPLDYAAMFHDPFIFEYLVSSKKRVDIYNTDDDGLNVLHRLSGSRIRRNRTECYFFWLPFCGESTCMDNRVKRTVKAIKALGGHLEQLTTPHRANRRLEESPRANNTSHIKTRQGSFPFFQCYTPLMMAALGSWPGVVDALLESGANVATTNDRGNTALHCFPTGSSSASIEIVSLLLSAGAKVNSRNLEGLSALCKAATGGNIDLMDLLLSHGADIEERYNLSSIHSGANVFALLAREDPPFDDSRDLKVAKLLERHVFSHPDAEKARRVIEQCDDNGSSTLYTFAGRFMRHSVGALVRHGANVNSLTNVHTVRWTRGNPTRISWQQSPLDMVIDSKHFITESMKENVKFTVPEYNSICLRADTVMKILQDAGGTQVPPRMTFTSLTREQLFAGGDFMKSLREL
ncbi:hypothetical protein F5Y13DRAFT_13055 [Hypoxylon sp. FL1857]|nr:hypothetical protein F5Y13DRAFT_13055 [Hypoxylon sp. FL1857]